MELRLTLLDGPEPRTIQITGPSARIGVASSNELRLDPQRHPGVAATHVEVFPAGTALRVHARAPVLVGTTTLEPDSVVPAGSVLQLGDDGPRVACELSLARKATTKARSGMTHRITEAALLLFALVGLLGLSWLLFEHQALRAQLETVLAQHHSSTEETVAELRLQLAQERTATREREQQQGNLHRKLLEELELTKRAAQRTELELRRELLEMRGRHDRVASELDLARAELARSEGRSARFAQAVRRSNAALYLVAVQRRNGQLIALGTAFAVRADGVLVTAAHVAAGQQQLVARLGQAGEIVTPLVLRNQDSSAALRVTRVLLHPDYEPGRAYSADVALLFVASDGAPLPAVMPLASTVRLQALSVGTPVGLLGFPVEVTDPNRPIATFKRGDISRVTTLDGGRGAREQEFLVQHTALASSGNSGSPLLDERGEVIAVHSSGLSVTVQGEAGTIQLRSSSGIQFALRADLIRSLLVEE